MVSLQTDVEQISDDAHMNEDMDFPEEKVGTVEVLKDRINLMR